MILEAHQAAVTPIRKYEKKKTSPDIKSKDINDSIRFELKMDDTIKPIGQKSNT